MKSRSSSGSKNENTGIVIFHGVLESESNEKFFIGEEEQSNPFCSCGRNLFRWRFFAERCRDCGAVSLILAETAKRFSM